MNEPIRLIRERARQLHAAMLYAVGIGDYDTWDQLNERYAELVDGLMDRIIGDAK